MMTQHTSDPLVTSSRRRGWFDILRLRPLTAQPHVAVIVSRHGRFVSIIPPGSRSTLSDVLDWPADLREVDMRERVLVVERTIPSRDGQRPFHIQVQVTYRVQQPARVALDIADPLGDLEAAVVQHVTSTASLLGVEQADALQNELAHYFRADGPFEQRARDTGIMVRRTDTQIHLSPDDRKFADALLEQMQLRPFNAQFVVGRHQPDMAVAVQVVCLYRITSRRGLARNAADLETAIHTMFEVALERLAKIVPHYTLRELHSQFMDRLATDRIMTTELSQLDVDIEELALTIEQYASQRQPDDAAGDEPPDWLKETGERIVAVGTTPIDEIHTANERPEPQSGQLGAPVLPAIHAEPEPLASVPISSAPHDAAAWLTELDVEDETVDVDVGDALSDEHEEWILEGPVELVFEWAMTWPGYKLYLLDETPTITDRLDRAAHAGTLPEEVERDLEIAQLFADDEPQAPQPEITAPQYNTRITQRLFAHEADEILGSRGTTITRKLEEHEAAPLRNDDRVTNDQSLDTLTLEEPAFVDETAVSPPAPADIDADAEQSEETLFEMETSGPHAETSSPTTQVLEPVLAGETEAGPDIEEHAELEFEPLAIPSEPDMLLADVADDALDLPQTDAPEPLVNESIGHLASEAGADESAAQPEATPEEIQPIAVRPVAHTHQSRQIERWIEVLRSDGNASFQTWATRICHNPAAFPSLLRGLIRDPDMLMYADDTGYQHALVGELEQVLAEYGSPSEAARSDTGMAHLPVDVDGSYNNGRINGTHSK